METESENSTNTAIEPQKLYSIKHAQLVSGIGTYGFRQMRNSGLKVCYLGRKAFVLGSDLIDHILSNSREKK